MKTKTKFSCSVSFSVGLFLLSGPAFSDQLVVNGNTTPNIVFETDKSYAAIPGTGGFSPANAAVYAYNNGQINGTNLDITSGGFTNNFGLVYASTGGKITLTDSTVQGARGLMANGSGSIITMTGGTITINSLANIAQANDGGNIWLNNVNVTNNSTASGTPTVAAYGTDSIIYINGGSISTEFIIGIGAESSGTIWGNNVTITTVNGNDASAVRNFGGKINLDTFSLSTTGYGGSDGVNTQANSTTKLKKGTILTKGNDASGIWVTSNNPNTPATVIGNDITITTSGLNAYGIQADGSGATVDLVDTRITTLGDSAYGLIASSGLSTIIGPPPAGSFDEFGSTISMSGGTIETHGTDSHAAIIGSGGGIALNNVNATTKGNGSNLLRFIGNANHFNIINVTGGVLRADNAPAIYAGGANNTLNLTGTNIAGNSTLLDIRERVSNPNPAFFTMTADASLLTGGARVDDVSQSNVTLKNNTLWTLTAAADGSTASAVSNLTVDNSTITFAEPVANTFQTLTVGSGNPGGTAQYVANGLATLSMNTWFNEGGALPNQQTDRLLINGDVTGITLVQVNGVAGSPEGLTSPDGSNRANEGISLIQVAGNATATSFQLAGEYVTLNGMPYQYNLYDYGPGSVNGAADDHQRLVTGTSPYWDYRLQSVLMDTDTSEKIPQVAPQVSAYIIEPTALFDAGLQDISNLHSRLGEIRNSEPVKGTNTGEFFIRAYGGKYDYSSNRNITNYGYDADFDYAAAQMGGNLFIFKNSSGIARLGIAGTMGSLSYYPKHVDGDASGRFDTWSVAAYATYLHSSGAYIDGTVSAGAFDGHVSTSLRGRTADLKGTSFSASLETGYPITLGSGFVFEPQAQLVYQRLMFDQKYDIDNFVVSLGNQDQFTGRLGARLSHSFTAGNDSLITVYATANVRHGFVSGGKIFLGDTFELGRYGTALEGRLGIDAKASKNLSLYADAGYQHKVGQSGVSGISINGGLRYTF